MATRVDYINLIPQELLANILTRLAAKSLGQCKTVLKSWNSLISNPYFIKTHIPKTTSTNTLILISSKPEPSIYSVHFNNSNRDGFATKLNFNCDNKMWDWVWGSFDGLILVEANRICSGMFLLNPTTLESKKLPFVHLDSVNFHNRRSLFGFGYDLSSDDYVVVSLWYQYILKNEFYVYVYMLKKNQWKKVGISPYDHKVTNPATGIPAAGIFVKGSLHWLAKNYDDKDSWHISAFNIANDEFSEVPPPNGVKNLSLRHSRLGVLKGCLYLMAVVKKSTELWVMKEYGVVESWIKLSFDLTRDSQIVSLDFPEDSLVVREGGQFVLRGSDAREVIKVLGLPDNSIYRVGMTFVDSLVSP